MSNFQKCVLVALCLNFNDMLFSMNTVYRPDFSAYNARKNEFLSNIQNVATATDHEKGAKTNMEEVCDAINSGDITSAISYFKSSMSCNSYNPTARIFLLTIKGLRIIGDLKDDVVVYDYGGVNANVRKTILETSDKHLELLFGTLSEFVKTNQNFSDDEFCEYLRERIKSHQEFDVSTTKMPKVIKPSKKEIEETKPKKEARINRTVEVNGSMLQYNSCKRNENESSPTKMPKAIKPSKDEVGKTKPKKEAKINRTVKINESMLQDDYNKGNKTEFSSTKMQGTMPMHIKSSYIEHSVSHEDKTNPGQKKRKRTVNDVHPHGDELQDSKRKINGEEIQR